MEAYRQYRGGYFHAKALLASADAIADGQVRQDAIRAAAVVVCAEFEAFIRDIMQERLDAVSKAWDDLTVAERRLVATAIVSELRTMLAKVDEVGARQADRVAQATRRAAKWVDSPGVFAKEVSNVRLHGFHESSDVANVVTRLLVQLRDDRMKFFDWLASHGVDANAYKLSLEALVELRADVAHQLRLGKRPTADDVRLYQRRSAALVRRVVSYVAGRLPG